MSDYFSFNKVVLVGRIAQEIHTREIKGGATKMAWFQLATNEIFKGKKSAYFLRVVTFGTLAEIVMKYGHKGRLALVEGKLHSRVFEDEGTKKTMVEVLAEQIIFLEKKEEGAGEPEVITTRQGESYKRPVEEEDSPEEEEPPF